MEHGDHGGAEAFKSACLWRAGSGVNGSPLRPVAFAATAGLFAARGGESGRGKKMKCKNIEVVF